MLVGLSKSNGAASAMASHALASDDLVSARKRRAAGSLLKLLQYARGSCPLSAPAYRYGSVAVSVVSDMLKTKLRCLSWSVAAASPTGLSQ